MSDLVDFLHARLDEDEESSHRATRAVMRGAQVWNHIDPEVVAHISRITPARVMAEVEAKRSIIDWAIRYAEEDYAPWNEDLLRLLAQPYADHPDFDPAWRADE